MKKALTIAGSDPCGGAGIQADLKTFWKFGVYGLSVVTSVTAQNTVDVQALYPLPARVVIQQIEAVLSDTAVQAIKTGMLCCRSVVRAVIRGLKSYSMPNLVIDPVTIATSGATLLEPRGVELLKRELIPLATLITPNLSEAEMLTSTKPIRTLEEMKNAAERLRELGPEFVLIKGGHLENEAVDILFDGQRFWEFRAKKLPLKVHGTGCVFSAAITAGLARGWDVPKAVGKAKEFITQAIEASVRLGKGERVFGL